MPGLSLSRLGTLRSGLGVLHLAFPGLGGRALGPFGPRARAVVRVLGARQLVQGVLSGVRPTGPVLALGAEVDAAHLASMVALGMLSRRWRRAAIVESVIAAGLGWAGLAAARAAGQGRGPAWSATAHGAGASASAAGSGVVGRGDGLATLVGRPGPGRPGRGFAGLDAWALRDAAAAALAARLVPRCLFWEGPKG